MARYIVEEENEDSSLRKFESILKEIEEVRGNFY
jgi:hypothetical protein